MYKLLFLGLVVVGLGLYFTGALEFEDSSSSVSVSVDKDKAMELGESLKDRLQD